MTARQVIRLGLTRDDVTRLVDAGDLRRVRRGVYAMRHASRTYEDDIAAWLHFERDRLPWERHGEEPSYVVRAVREALAEELATREEIMTAARNRKSQSRRLQARTAALLDQAA